MCSPWQFELRKKVPNSRLNSSIEQLAQSSMPTQRYFSCTEEPSCRNWGWISSNPTRRRSWMSGWTWLAPLATQRATLEHSNLSASSMTAMILRMRQFSVNKMSYKCFTNLQKTYYLSLTSTLDQEEARTNSVSSTIKPTQMLSWSMRLTERVASGTLFSASISVTNASSKEGRAASSWARRSCGNPLLRTSGTPIRQRRSQFRMMHVYIKA